ncbi:MAG: protein-methionine-sulfoxide reductase heme-binding subunit MsrQ [Flavimaricola sp.]|nr:protein-methionine-sulfoxide reductase heme-binding subunit MsrQ [Flavimaricola sp.]
MQVVGGINTGLRKVPAWLVYLAGLGWAAYLFWLGLSNQLGPEPINTLERLYGDVAIKLLILGLAVTPLRKWPGLNLMKFRRAIGLTAFGFVLAHFLVFAILDVQTLERVWTEIVKRPYVTIGMAGFLLLIPLAVTSNNLSVRKLGGAGWRKLHKLTYAAALLGAVHYLWLVKGFQIEPVVYTALIVGLLLTRIKWSRARAVFA